MQRCLEYVRKICNFYISNSIKYAMLHKDVKCDTIFSFHEKGKINERTTSTIL